MPKYVGNKKRIMFLFIMSIVGSIFALIFLAINGNGNQVINDIVVEYTSILQSNKSAERNLLFLLIFAGIIIYLIYYMIEKKRSSGIEQTVALTFNESNQKSKEFMCALVAIAATSILIYNNNYQIVTISIFYAVILFVIDSELTYAGICLYYLSVYSVIALFRIYAIAGGEYSINNMMVAVAAFIISVIPLLFRNKKRVLMRLSMLEAIIIPFTLLVYLADRYKYGNEYMVIDAPNATRNIILIIIAAFIIEAVIILIKKWNKAEKIEEIITLGSCVVIMAFNRFDGTGAIMPVDMHHPFENIIGYSQVLELGQIPFKNYIPVSGMYSIVQGAVFNFFGDGGTFANYYITNNLFYLFIIIVIIALLRTQIESSYVLLISLIYYVQTYNRQIFMLPIMLLLLWPKLIDKKNAWLITWFLTSLFQGLYYPLYGVATCVAFFPLGIWQMVTFIKSGELKKRLKDYKFWIGWGICLILLVVCVRYLVGTLRHMLAMSGQSLLADGISRFGQLVPTWFFPYFGNEYLGLKLALYYIFTIMIPVIFVWIAFAIAIKFAGIRFVENKIIINNKKKMCCALAVVIMPIICYTFTFTRLDIDGIYARSTGVLFAGMVLVLVLSWSYIKESKLRILLVYLMLLIPAVVNMEGIFATENDSKLAVYYAVPENYIFVDNDEVEKLGTGFINKDVYANICSLNEQFKNKDKELSYMGDPSLFGYFYLLGIKGDGAMELTFTVKSLSAVQETIEIAKDNQSIIGPSFTSYYNYYLYYWLMTSGEYYWDADLWDFIPNNGKYTNEEVIAINKRCGITYENLNIAKTASSWGASMGTLMKLFTIPDIDYNIRTENNTTLIEFTEPINGNTADFVYIEFANMEENYEYTLYNLSGEFVQKEDWLSKYLMKKNYNPNMIVNVGWQDENSDFHTITCNMSKGKLLIPIGAGARWLNNQHSYISIQLLQDNVDITMPEITEIKFFKIREAK